MVQKMPSFFFRELQLITVLPLICDSYVRLRFVSLNVNECLRFPIFDSVSFLLKFMLLLTKSMDSFTLKPHNFFFAPRPLIFKLQQEVLKFDYICVSWSYPKTDLETSVLKLEN